MASQPSYRLGLAPLLPLLALCTAVRALSFTVANGQVFTPGPAIVDAPQPGTPLGGGMSSGPRLVPMGSPLTQPPPDYLEVAIDVTASGRLPLPGNLDADSPSRFHNLTIFLSSYDTQHNFTVSNGTANPFSATAPVVLAQEPGSTVKHVRWRWPACLVGQGQPVLLDSARGVYNISLRQSYRLNGAEFYTIFDLPVSVTNAISDTAAEGDARPPCDALDNPLLPPDQVADSGGVLFAPGDATQVAVKGSGLDAAGDGLGPAKPAAKPGDGLGSSGAAAGARAWSVAQTAAAAACACALLLLLP